jgi:hypothetical protein
MSSYKKPSNYTSIPVTCSTSREPLKTSKIDRIQQSPWRPATVYIALKSLNPRYIHFTKLELHYMLIHLSLKAI